MCLCKGRKGWSWREGLGMERGWQRAGNCRYVAFVRSCSQEEVSWVHIDAKTDYCDDSWSGWRRGACTTSIYSHMDETAYNQRRTLEDDEKIHPRGGGSQTDTHPNSENLCQPIGIHLSTNYVTHARCRACRPSYPSSPLMVMSTAETTRFR